MSSSSPIQAPGRRQSRAVFGRSWPLIISSASITQAFLALGIVLRLRQYFSIAPFGWMKACWQDEARFNSDVSHELRSPLTTLSASVEVLEADHDDLPERSQRALQLLSDDLRRFQRMVADLLEMSRADGGSVDVFLEDVRVGELVPRSVEAGFAHMEYHGNATPPAVRVDPAVDAVHVGVDKRRFERVMVNLLENADHYGGGATVVGAGMAAGDGALVELTVDDAGPGIDPLERTKVFDRFYRGSESGRRGTGTGTGLGLALVAEHMRVMRGAVRVESSPEGGARFVLTLPALADDQPEAEGDIHDGTEGRTE